MKLSEYEISSQSQAIQNLYFSSLVAAPPQLYEYDKNEFFGNQKAWLDYLEMRRQNQLIKSVPAQLTLAFRFEHGIGLEKACETAVAYYEQPARATTEYVKRTFALDSIEREKLNLLGPFVVSE